MIRIAVCAPSRPIAPTLAEALVALAQAEFPDVAITVHPQCFASDGHFAGSDAERLAALLECANDPAFDAVWFARGGYGAGRIAHAAMARLGPASGDKRFLGYSDAGYLLGALDRCGIGRPVHAPMPFDLGRPGGEEAIRRVLRYLGGEDAGVELAAAAQPAVAFNLTTLAMLCGTPIMPMLAGRVVMVEEVSEHLYAVDRLFFHLTAHLAGIAGLRLGRVSDIPRNDVDFGLGPLEIARHWCDARGVAFLGAADIGHDAANKIVPFGLAIGGQEQ